MGAWLVSRLLGLASILGAAMVRPNLVPRGLVRGFLSWDSQWYVGIARVGYRFTLGPGRLRSYPFFPLSYGRGERWGIAFASSWIVL